MSVNKKMLCVIEKCVDTTSIHGTMVTDIRTGELEMTTNNIRPWACFVTVGHNTTVKHTKNRALARLAATIAQQKNPNAVTKIRRANRQNAKKLYMLVHRNTRYTLEVLRTEVAPAPVKVKIRTAPRKATKVETLTFAFIGA